MGKRFSKESWQMAHKTMCDGKRRFKSENAAQKCLDYVRYKRLGITKDHHPYQCPHCHGWHIGSLH